MKNLTLSFYFFMVILFLIPQPGRSQVFMKLSNPTDMPRKTELVSIEGDKLAALIDGIDTSNLVITDTATHQEIVYQIERLGSGNRNSNSNGWRLLIQADLAPKATRVLKISEGLERGQKQGHVIESAAKAAAGVFCRYVPERLDDFAWENDKIAFRMYGKALENDIGNAKGIDVWTKRTAKLILNEWYKKDDYHVDHGEGLDYYDVGLTLGAGDNAPFFEDSVWFPKNYTKYRILDSGPLRCTFELSYDPWIVGSQRVDLVKIISLDLGSQLSKIRAKYTFRDTKNLDVVVGIVKRDAPGSILFDELAGVMSYWQPNDLKNGTTGVGVVFTKPVKMVQTGKHQLDQLLGLINLQSGATLEYYAGAAWDKAGMISSARDWNQYLQDFATCLNIPLQVQVYKLD